MFVFVGLATRAGLRRRSLRGARQSTGVETTSTLVLLRRKSPLVERRHGKKVRRSTVTVARKKKEGGFFCAARLSPSSHPHARTFFCSINSPGCVCGRQCWQSPCRECEGEQKKWVSACVCVSVGCVGPPRNARPTPRVRGRGGRPGARPSLPRVSAGGQSVAGRTPSGIAAEKKGATAGCLMSQPGGKKNGGAPVRARAGGRGLLFSRPADTPFLAPPSAGRPRAVAEPRARRLECVFFGGGVGCENGCGWVKKTKRECPGASSRPQVEKKS